MNRKQFKEKLKDLLEQFDNTIDEFDEFTDMPNELNFEEWKEQFECYVDHIHLYTPSNIGNKNDNKN